MERDLLARFLMRKTWLLFSQTVTVAVAVLFVVATLKPDWLPRRAATTALAPTEAASAVAPLAPPVQPVALVGGMVATSYAPAAKRAAPAVVSITASRAPARAVQGDDPVFNFFFGRNSRRQQ